MPDLECTCSEGWDEHACPFAEDVHDTVVLCECCPFCEHECAMDI